MSTTIDRLARASLLALILLGADSGARETPARAAGSPQQFLLIDEVVSFRANGAPFGPAWIESPFDGFYMVFMGDAFSHRRSPEIPDNWLDPVDFSRGKLHVRVEVLNKPDDITTSGLILRLITDNHSGVNTYWLCTRTCKFTAPGVHHFEEDVAKGLRPYGDKFRFDRPLYEMQVSVTDAKEGIVHRSWEGGYFGKPNLDLYLPLEVRLTAYVVAPGATFAPPPFWHAKPRGEAQPKSWSVDSPDGKVGAVVRRSEDGRLSYTVWSGHETERRPVVGWSPLGLTRDDVDLTRGLDVVKVTRRRVRDRYRLLHGKASQVDVDANELVLRVARDGHEMDLALRAANDGVAYQYRLRERPGVRYTVTGEASGFQISPTARAFMLAHDEPSTWAPSYEGYWSEVSAATTSPTRAGWSFPALFAVNGPAERGEGTDWVLITEAGLERGWAGTRLASEAPGGLYTVRLPDAGEGMGTGGVEPTPAGPSASPWRVIITARALADVVASTMVTDLAPASRVRDPSFVRPGVASWSWWSQDTGDPSRVRRFIDLAHDMGWAYSLIDAGWDRFSDAELRDLVAYARDKNVRLLLWYNSGGQNNQVEGTPRDRMTDAQVRRAELTRIAKLGFAGIKVDFFHSDKPVAIAQYLDILEDAARLRLLVNFHGCTLPRGWQRTYPNLLTLEAVRGEEMYKSDREYPARGPQHQLILPFTRNVVGPMDFTPVGLSDVGHARKTSDAFELAQAVVFESGLVHMADDPSAYARLPREAQDYLRSLPAAWDETRLLAGVPGAFVVMARRVGKRVFVAGMSAAPYATDLSFVPPFLAKGAAVAAAGLMDPLDDSGRRLLNDRRLTTTTVTATGGALLTVPVAARGGFVLQFALDDRGTTVAHRK